MQQITYKHTKSNHKVQNLTYLKKVLIVNSSFLLEKMCIMCVIKKYIQGEKYVNY